MLSVFTSLDRCNMCNVAGFETLDSLIITLQMWHLDILAPLLPEMSKDQFLILFPNKKYQELYQT